MMNGSLRSGLLLAVLFFLIFDLHAQQEKKVSFNGFVGVVSMPGGEKLNNAGRPANIFGGYPLAPSVGAGLNYRFNPGIHLTNNLFFFSTSKANQSFSASGLKTSVRFFPLKDTRAVSPYLSAGININFLNLKRRAYTEEFLPDTSANVIGAGISVSRIVYNHSDLKLSFVPSPGISLGAGLNFRITYSLNLFLDYTFNQNSIKSSLIKDNYPSNKANLRYHFVSAGLTFKLMHPMKQMLATLQRSDWDGDPTVTVRGKLVYKNEKKSNEKVVPVEIADVRDTLVATLPTSKTGYFEYKNMRPDDYKFMLGKRNKKIIKADLQIVHDNSRVDIFEEFPELEMIDYESDNIISRDNNFSVILREGFQHEVDVTVLGGNVVGKVTPVSNDTLCRNMLVLLKDLQNNVLAVANPESDCSFTFPDVEPGPHKIVFVRKDTLSKDMRFAYSFENPPLIRRQYNTDADSLDYDQYDFVETPEVDTADINDILLSRSFAREIETTESLLNLEGKRLPDTVQLALSGIIPGYHYAPDGSMKEPGGYGVQVAAFTNLEEVQDFCNQLSEETREPVFVQAVVQEDSYNPVVYRVIVGEYPDEETAGKEMKKLKKEGYPTIIRKHRKYSKSRGR